MENQKQLFTVNQEEKEVVYEICYKSKIYGSYIITATWSDTFKRYRCEEGKLWSVEDALWIKKVFINN